MRSTPLLLLCAFLIPQLGSTLQEAVPQGVELWTSKSVSPQSRNGTSINAGNVRKRFLKPVAKELGIEVCGWHDFRHSLNREMRRNGVDSKVRSGALGHKKVNPGDGRVRPMQSRRLGAGTGVNGRSSCDPNLGAP